MFQTRSGGHLTKVCCCHFGQRSWPARFGLHLTTREDHVARAAETQVVSERVFSAAPLGSLDRPDPTPGTESCWLLKRVCCPKQTVSPAATLRGSRGATGPESRSARSAGHAGRTSDKLALRWSGPVVPRPKLLRSLANSGLLLTLRSAVVARMVRLAPHQAGRPCCSCSRNPNR